MKKIYTLFLFFYGIAYCSVSLDTAVDVAINGRTIIKPFVMAWNNHSGIAFNRDGAIRGECGMRLTGSSTGGSCSCEMDFSKESWFRFFIRIDSVVKDTFTEAQRRTENSTILFPMIISVSDKLQPDQSEALFQFELHKTTNDNSYKLTLANVNADYSYDTLITADIKAGIEYCIESKIDFPDSNLAHIMLIVNGREIGGIERKWYYPLRYFKITCTANSYEGYRWFVSLDEFAVSNKRIFSIPPKPLDMTTVIRNNVCSLIVSSNIVDVEKQQIAASEWRLYSEADSNMPVFFYIEKNPKKIFSRIIPFNISNGSYFWQTKFVNAQGISSDWSRPAFFSQDKDATQPLIIKKCQLFQRIGGKPTSEIKAGEWYWFSISFSRSIPADSVLYFMVSINDSSYLFGHPGNKFGEYLPCHNFIYNISVGGNGIRAFEKHKPNSIISDYLQGNIGSYLDGRREQLVFDTINNELHFRGKVIDSLQSRIWRLSAVAYYVGRDTISYGYFGHAPKGFVHSNVYRTYITVTSVGMKGDNILVKVTIIAVFLSVIVMFSLFYLKREKFKRKIYSEIKPDREYEMISRYINDNIASELSANGIRNSLHLSYGRFYEIMNRNKKKLPQLINEIRINRAKELIVANPEKNFDEIGYMIGVKSSSYFYRIFKGVSGKTPKEYKDYYGRKN
jgi:AraC-like DNA-binding protein